MFIELGEQKAQMGMGRGGVPGRYWGCVLKNKHSKMPVMVKFGE